MENIKYKRNNKGTIVHKMNINNVTKIQSELNLGTEILDREINQFRSELKNFKIDDSPL